MWPIVPGIAELVVGDDPVLQAEIKEKSAVLSSFNEKKPSIDTVHDVIYLKMTYTTRARPRNMTRENI